jgi:tyrosyl-tRNA synthetase
VFCRFLDFNAITTNAAVLVNNYEDERFVIHQFARDVGKRITVNYMMAKDSVKKDCQVKAKDVVYRVYLPIQGYDFSFAQKIQLLVANGFRPMGEYYHWNCGAKNERR